MAKQALCRLKMPHMSRERQDALAHFHPLYNTDAGDHPYPADQREIDAVLRATVRCYTVHPYFVARYGARGAAFTRSDGGYLVTLADHPQDHVRDQVAWLTRMLSSRGMPRWLMEDHLDVLSEELTAAIPDRANDYCKLRSAALELREERQARISQNDFEVLAADFGSASGGGLKNVGGLLIAAVCDEYCGLTEAVPSLTTWLCDIDRFSPQWRAAVADTLAKARALAVGQRGSSA